MKQVRVGSRIKLIHTDDQYTKLKSGDLGTVTGWSYLPNHERQIWVHWDTGSSLMMLEDHDEFEIL